MIYRFNQFELNEERRELRDGGTPVSMQPLTFDTLALLVQNHGRVVQKKELLDEIWPDGFVSEASLQRAISLVRTALNDEEHQVIQTFPGRGYRFCADVQEVTPPSPSLTDGVDTAEADGASPIGAESSGKARRLVEPRIQYARTSDAVNIAYWSLGDGPALVCLGDAPSSHVRLEWHIDEVRSWYEALARQRQLVRFDARGGGLSDRDVEEFSLEAFHRDLDAVVDTLGLQRFALFAFIDSGPVAISYAARNPDRVSHLILWCTYAANNWYTDLPQIKAVRALMDRDYKLYTETLAHMCLGWASGEPVRRMAQLMREGYSREELAKIYAAIAKYDVVDDLARVSMPTLVMHPRGLEWFPEDSSRRMAAGIPNAQLAILDRTPALPFVGDWQDPLDIIEEFLNEAPAG